MSGSAGAAHPPHAEASSSSTSHTAKATGASAPHHASALDAAKLLMGNLWRADDVYFEAVKAGDGAYRASYASSAIERLLGVSPEAALAAWRGCSDALEGGVHSQARFPFTSTGGAALDRNAHSQSRPHDLLTPQDAARVDGHARSGLHGAC